MGKPWIGFDLDQTISHADTNEWKGPNWIGKPILPMIMKMKRMIKEGKLIKIFTARVDRQGDVATPIKDWLEEQGLPRLQVVNIKDKDMMEIYDDK